MSHRVTVAEKYERHGWPSVDRPDLKPPDGWSLALVNSVNLIHHHALSPDGQQVAFVWERDGRSDIYTQALAGGWPRRVSADRAKTIYWWDSPPRWSPDGRRLAFTQGGHVHVAPADGRGLSRAVSDFAAAAWSPVWLPDSAGIIIAAERNDAHILLLTDRDGRWPRLLAGNDSGDNLEAAPSSDGRYVAYIHRPFDDLNRWDLRLIDITSGETRMLFGLPKEKAWSPRWSPDGRWLAFLSQRSGWTEVWAIGPDGDGLRQLTRLNADVTDFAIAPDGTRLAVCVEREENTDLLLVEVDGGATRTLRPAGGCYAAPHWSPDGRFLTVEYESAILPPDIYRVTVDGGHMTALTFSLPPALAALDLVTPEHRRYPSFDGLEIPALLWRPKTPRPPGEGWEEGAAIIRPHGGPADRTRNQWDALAQYFVAKGYTYLAPNFRGSTGYGRAFEHANYNNWGVGDTQDVLHGARFLHTLGVDPARIGILGSSYGGYMVACSLARDPDTLFACGVSKYGDANVYSSWAQCERGTRLYTEMMLGHPRDNWAVYRAASPIHEMANVRAPILLLHGLADDVVPPQASEEWAEALRRHDKVFEYVTYAGEPHGFLRHETEMDWQRRTERFFDWYLRA
ncbi:MAG: S9 family peptidase [Anaerolineae bacterium]|nr:S9 family peptidase [Anaerolineae bacterium]